MLPNVSLHEPRSVTRGAYGGPSIHVAKGLTLRVGGFQAQSHEELKAIDSGALVLTTKRLCFAGRLRSIEVPLRQADLSRSLLRRRCHPPVWARRRPSSSSAWTTTSTTSRYEGRSYQEPMSGLILKYAIEGLLACPSRAHPALHREAACPRRSTPRAGRHPRARPSATGTPRRLARSQALRAGNQRALPPAGPDGGPRPQAPGRDLPRRPGRRPLGPWHLRSPRSSASSPHCIRS